MATFKNTLSPSGNAMNSHGSLLKGMATIPCNPVTYMFVIVRVIKEKGVVLTFHGRNSWDDGDVKV
jgi:hypothetical protein